MQQDNEQVQAYKNHEFLMSREARMIRIMCEFEETAKRLRANNVKETIMFFGSARGRTREQHKAEQELNQKKLDDPKSTEEEKEKARFALDRLEKGEWMCEMMEVTTELSRRLTEWSMTYKSPEIVGGGFLARGNDIEHQSKRQKIATTTNESKPHPQTLVVCTGGGPGLMEAANRGATLVEGARNIGMKITLPFEQKRNPYVSPGLCFQYHYFFTRKYWMIFACRALIVAPGGFGTLDELFELLTLKKEGKVKYDVPIVLLGAEFWNSVLNLDYAIEMGMITKEECGSLLTTSDVDEAFNFVTTRILAMRDQEIEKKKQ